MRKPTARAALTGLFLLALAACDPAPSGNDAAAGAGTDSALAANSSGPEPAAAPSAAPVVLEGAGLRIPGASRALAFGLPEAATTQALTRAFGRPPGELGENEECGGGAMKFARWKDELTVWYLDGSFAGWDNDGGLKTLEGIGIGSRRTEAAALPGFEVEESSLGIEFRAGGLSGILESQAPDAKVIHLWGGATCVFR